MDSSTVLIWIDPFCKRTLQIRSDATLCGACSGSAPFACDPCAGNLNQDWVNEPLSRGSPLKLVL